MVRSNHRRTLFIDTLSTKRPTSAPTTPPTMSPMMKPTSPAMLAPTRPPTSNPEIIPATRYQSTCLRGWGRSGSVLISNMSLSSSAETKGIHAAEIRGPSKLVCAERPPRVGPGPYYTRYSLNSQGQICGQSDFDTTQA